MRAAKVCAFGLGLLFYIGQVTDPTTAKCSLPSITPLQMKDRIGGCQSCQVGLCVKLVDAQHGVGKVRRECVCVCWCMQSKRSVCCCVSKPSMQHTLPLFLSVNYNYCPLSTIPHHHSGLTQKTHHGAATPWCCTHENQVCVS